MKKIILTLIAFFLCYSCSLDNKTGIWKDSSKVEKKIVAQNKTTKIKSVFEKDKIFNKEISANSEYIVKLNKTYNNNEWIDSYLNETNATPNFSYKNNKILVFKSKNLFKRSSINNFLYNKNNIISFDNKGTIFVYSLDLREKIFEYNFYKKKFKKYKKEIYIVIKNNKIFAADNLGYVYCVDILTTKLIWAKNTGIPFRSNIKIVDNNLFVANQDNTIFSFNISSGEKKWSFSTSQAFLTTDFINSIAINKKINSVIMLNTNGELTSINYEQNKINWIINFKSASSFSENTNLFLGSPILIEGENLIISADNTIQNHNILSGQKKWVQYISSKTKILTTNENIFLINEANLLICIDIKSGKIVWSQNIFNDLNKKIKKKIGKITNILAVENKIMLFSDKGFLLSCNYQNGKLVSSFHISKNGINSDPIFVNRSMYLVNKKSQLLIFE